MRRRAEEEGSGTVVVDRVKLVPASPPV